MQELFPGSRRVRTGAVLTAAAFLGGAALSDASMAGVASFADVSIAGAVALPYSAALFTGGLLRCVISGIVGKNIVRLTAMLIALTVRLFADTDGKPALTGGVAAASVIAAGAGVSALIGELPYKLFFYIFYGAAAGACSGCISHVLLSLRRQRLLRIKGISGFAYGMVFTLLISSLSSSRIGGIPLDIGLAAGTAASLAGAYFYGSVGGAVCGVLTVCGAFLASAENGAAASLLPAAALLTGCIKRQKYSVSALAFVVTSFLLIVLSGFTDQSIRTAVSELCGVVIFVLAAPFWSDRWIAAGDGGAGELLPELIMARNRHLSGILGSVCRDIESVAGTGNGSEKADSRAEQETVCSDCWKRSVCHSSEGMQTERGFRILESLPEITSETFPYELAGCVRRERIMRAFGQMRMRKMSDMALGLGSRGTVCSLSEQLKLSQELLRTVRADSDGIRFSKPLSERIESRLERRGAEAERVFAYYNAAGRIVAELYLPESDEPESDGRLCDLIADELGVQVVSGCRSVTGEGQRLIVSEPAGLSAEICTSSISADDSGCGDTTAAFSDGERQYIVLSDGMGCGAEAARISQRTAELFRRLVCGGAELTAAVRLINSVIPAYIGEESFATLDAACVDTDRGKLTLVKSGAADTLILRGGNVMKVSASTFPVGISGEADVFAAEYDFTAGDTAVMFSDGVSENEYLFIKELLLGGGSPGAIAEEICRKAEVFNQASRSDDVTVIVFRVTENSQKI